MLNLNINEGDFSLRTNLNLENDFSEAQKNDPRLRFYNLYLEARNIMDIATIKLGRQPLFNSVGGGLFDGATLDLKKEAYKFTAYFGGNVPAYQKLELTDDFSNDYLFGGKFVTTVLTDFQFGLGYINKNFKPYEYMATRFDADLNPIQVLISNNSNEYEFASADIAYHKKDIIDINTRADYDLNFKEVSKFEVDARYVQVENLGVSVYYNYREPLIRYNSIFSVFDYGNTQEIEGGLDYKISEYMTVLAKFANVTFKDENSQRLTAGVVTRYGSINYRKNLGYAGELDAVSLYSAYTLMEGLLTPSLGLSYTSYKLSKDSEKNNLTSLLAGINVRPYRMLSFDLQGQYMDNKIYKNDLRLFFKVNYWFNTNLNFM
ncbi:MAG: hypothetical protein IPM56_09130 [Ignavibacteriales bacterium]|nr:MAG: hypothetical protein IPM56_09130 [Ignavibacteriales bacterium]